MCKIKRIPLENADKFILGNVLWGYDKYTAEVYAQLAYDDTGFLVKFTVGEADPLRTKTKHFESVHEDSCVEFFVNFMPEKNNRYINFEANTNGVMNASFRADRYDSEPLKLDEIESFHLTPEIHKDYWTLTYKISFDFIRNYYPEFDIKACKYVTGNLYKCGDKTEIEHYKSYYLVGTEKPDYHRPEYFGKFEVE